MINPNASPVKNQKMKQIKSKKQYGFFCFNSEEFAVVPWDEEAAHTYAADVGP